MDENNKNNNTENAEFLKTRVYGAAEPSDGDAAALDPAELARRFDQLGKEFRRAHSAAIQQRQTHPQGQPQQPGQPVRPSSQEQRPQQPDMTRAQGQQPPRQEQKPQQGQPQSGQPVRPSSQEQRPPQQPVRPSPQEQQARGQQPPRQEQRPPQPGQPQKSWEPPSAQKPPQTQAKEETPLTLDAIFAKDAAVANETGRLVKNRSKDRSHDDAGNGGRRRQDEKGADMAKATNRNGKNRGKKKKKQSLAGKIIKWAASVIVVLIIAAGLVGGIYIYGIYKDLPRYSTADLDASLKVMSTIYDDQGTPMKNIYLSDGQRTLVTYDQLPKNFVNALVAIEDKTFWTHKGFNLTRIIGAILESVTGGGNISGTSTITQQLARNIWLVDERSDYSFTRKIREAFYARELESNLSKEEILTAYLNTIFFGNHSYGIAAAAENYYDKKIEDLDLIESAALAALPAAQSVYSMITTVSPGEVSPDDPRIILTGSQYTYLYNDAVEPRLKIVLSSMLDQGYITQEEYDAAMDDNIRSHLRPKDLQIDSNSDFFVSYAIEQIADDLLASDPGLMSRDAAVQKIYSGGLDIYTTFSQRAQDIATEEFNNPENFPAVAPAGSDYDAVKNIKGDLGNILVFSHDYMFETREDGQWFHLIGDKNAFPYIAEKSDNEEVANRGDFAWREDGSMVIYSGANKRLAVYRTEGAGGPDINLEFKDYYVIRDEVWYIAKGGIISIPAEYKGIDEAGNMIISQKFFTSEHNVFTTDENGEIWIGPSHFTLRQEVLQPQTGFVLIDHTNGQLKAMIGGRDIKGQFQFNRAISPQPPGSTMKPLGVYGPAIEMSANGEATGSDVPTYGSYWSPVSIIIDEEIEYQGRKWPRNWDNNFRGPQTMRYSIENSMNVNAVKVQLAIGNQRSVNFLKKLGITTIVEQGASTDLVPGALALGGMTQGLTPLENASAYGAFANAGVHIKPITYTQVKDKRGNVLLDGAPQQTQAMNPGTAFIMNDMLRTTITNGIAGAAAVKGTSVAGKTGTTSDYFDAWFVGNTPKYSASVWIGCDVDIRLSQGSAAASRMFSKVMTRIIEGEDQGEYPAQPENVVRASVSTKPTNNPDATKTFTDYFIAGTAPQMVDMGVEQVEICLDTGFLATEWCPNREMREFSTIAKVDATGNPIPQAPEYYCHIHNLNPGAYPVTPGAQLYSNVPTLTNMTEQSARDALTAVNLVFGDIYPDHHPTVPAGQVFSQNPLPGEWIPQGYKVNVSISQGQDPNVQVPNLSGYDENGAIAALAASGLSMYVSSREPHASVAAGMVISQNPQAGSQATRGSTINVTISTGPPPQADP